MAGTKNDAGKPDLTLVSRELMILLARVREFGNKKYERGNWKKGFKVTRSLAAALRHIFAFLDGETFDKESGLSHLGHAIASIEHAVYDMEHKPENDDRDIKSIQERPNLKFKVEDIVITKDGRRGKIIEIHVGALNCSYYVVFDHNMDSIWFTEDDLCLDKRHRFQV